jgi:hypothetical protein
MRGFSKKDFPLARIRRFLEPGPVVLLSCARKGETKVPRTALSRRRAIHGVGPRGELSPDVQAGDAVERPGPMADSGSRCDLNVTVAVRAGC